MSLLHTWEQLDSLTPGNTFLRWLRAAVSVVLSVRMKVCRTPVYIVQGHVVELEESYKKP